jgi:putative FmdB family regulatory protein
MPIYAHACPKCGASRDVYRAIKDIENAPDCPKCGTRMVRQISAAMVIGDMQPYMTVAADKETGKRQFITSRSKHREFLKKNGYEELGNEKFTPSEPKEKTDEPDVPFSVFD